MKYNKIYLILLVFILSLPSCLITDNFRVYEFEILKPSAIIYPDDLDTISVFKRDLFQSDTIAFTYQKGLEIVKDSHITYSDLSNKCVDAFVNYLQEKNYFKLVKNYRDSLEYLKDEWKGINIFSEELFKQTKSDCCIFLDYFNFTNSNMNITANYFKTDVRLFWTLVIKNDSNVYAHRKIDELIFDEGDNPNFQNFKENTDLILFNAAQYLGDNLGSKFFPNWETTSRYYYKSKNTDMLKAEKLALSNHWLKAAEIWNKKTKSKNPRIVAKSCYNMALACEMEGQFDPAIDWLVKSYKSLRFDNESNVSHKIECEQYIKILALRKKQLIRLEKQLAKIPVPEN